MKYFSPFILFVSFLSVGLSAQVVSTEPVFPKETDTVTIIYDATKGNGALKGATQVYAHAGVITNQSTSSADWKYVIGNWGTADNRVKMTSLGNDKWQMRYHMKSFYQQAGTFKAGEFIKQMSFVFRDASGNTVGRATNGGDIFVDVYSASSTLLARIVSPETETVLGNNSTQFKLKGYTSKSCNIDVYLDGSIFRSVTSKDSVHAEFQGIGVGNHQVIMKATSGSQTAADTLTIVVNPSVVNAAIPSGLEQGINYIDDSTVYLVLYAPFKNYVYLLGDFNDWKPNVNYFMNYDANKFLYWIKLSGLTPGKEVAYQYLVNGDTRVADPFSPKMLNEWDDSYIPTNRYPGLKSYPKNKTNGWVTVMQPGAPKYEWKVTDFKRPLKSQLVIYECLIRDFTAAQTYKSVMDTLPYLKRLGITALQLMPITEFEGNISWGYNPASHMALDKYYGTREAFKALVDACHSLGIAVILDVVYNHAFSSAPICQLYWDAANFRPTANSPYAYQTAKHPFNVGYDLNHSTTQTQYYTKRTLKYLLEEYNIDGFRFDLSKGITQTDYGTDVAAWGRYDAWRINRLDDYHKHIQSISPGAFTILEHFADVDEEKELGNRGMMTWGNAVHQATEAAMGFVNTSDFGWGVDYIKRGMPANSVIAYASSHDEERMGYKCKMFGNAFGGYNTKLEDTYLQRNALTYAFVQLVPGPKMIWQFDELGFDYSINWCKDGTISDACRLVEKPARWDYWTGISGRPDLYYQHAMFNQLKIQNESVYAPTAHYFTSNGSFKRLQLNGQDFTTLVLGNFDVVNASKSPSFTQSGWWYDYLTGDSINVTDVNMSMNFSAGAYKIYTNKKVENTILRDLNRVSVQGFGSGFEGIKLYPVPANERLFVVGLAGVRYTVFNSLGQSILGDEYHDFIDVSNLNNGIYYLKSENGFSSAFLIQR